MREKCDCGKDAIWVYAPGYTSGDNPYHCDDCVPRGCFCNINYISDKLNPPDDTKDWKWIEEGISWCYIDEKGREYPCCEYMYDENGFEKE
jgi:hypothetical protein